MLIYAKIRRMRLRDKLEISEIDVTPVYRATRSRNGCVSPTVTK